MRRLSSVTPSTQSTQSTQSNQSLRVPAVLSLLHPLSLRHLPIKAGSRKLVSLCCVQAQCIDAAMPLDTCRNTSPRMLQRHPTHVVRQGYACCNTIHSYRDTPQHKLQRPSAQAATPVYTYRNTSLHMLQHQSTHVAVPVYSWAKPLYSCCNGVGRRLGAWVNSKLGTQSWRVHVLTCAHWLCKGPDIACRSHASQMVSARTQVLVSCHFGNTF